MKMAPSIYINACLAALGLVLTGTLHAAFEFKQQRYLAPHEILMALEQVFPPSFTPPSGGWSGSVPDDCVALGDENRMPLGTINPGDGKVPSSQPSPNFLSWYEECVQSYLWKLQANSSSLRELYVPAGLLARADLNSVPWSAFTQAERNQLVDRIVFVLIGDESVVLDYGLVENFDEFRRRVTVTANETPGIDTIVLAIIKEVVLQDEFLLR